MKTMNKFLKYFINFIVLFLLVSGLIYLGTMNRVEENKKQTIQCSVQSTSPGIEISECKKGKLTGTITNDTSILINVIYVKAEGFDKDNNLLETKYSEIKYFNVGEKSKFEIKFSNKNISKVIITSVEAKV